LLNNFYFTAEWNTSLTQEVRDHNIVIKLNRCSENTRLRDSIQIKLPKNITLNSAKAECLENNDFNELFQYLPISHSLYIGLSTILNSASSIEELTFKITLKETRKERNIRCY